MFDKLRLSVGEPLIDLQKRRYRHWKTGNASVTPGRFFDYPLLIFMQ